jgi:uncharacterized membrane protein
MRQVLVGSDTGASKSMYVVAISLILIFVGFGGAGFSNRKLRYSLATIVFPWQFASGLADTIKTEGWLKVPVMSTKVSVVHDKVPSGKYRYSYD